MAEGKRRQELEQVAADFHQCTALTIAGFTGRRELVCSKGATAEVLRDLLATSSVILQDCKCVSDCTGVHIPQCGRFAFVSVCRHCLDKGYFLVGPFSDGPTDSLEMRSPTVIPYLVRLIRFIQDRSLTKCYSHNAKEVSCLHVQRALDYIHDHYSEQITLHDMAKLLGLNKSYLSNLFRIETGLTFCQWLNQIRIERSKEYLKYTDQTIAAIAAAVGYTSQSYYTSLFSRHVGVTPNTYRQRWLGCNVESVNQFRI